MRLAEFKDAVQQLTPEEFAELRKFIADRLFTSHHFYGRGGGVGRPLGVSPVLGVGVGLAVEVGVGVTVAVAVTLAVAVAVGVGVNVAVAVAVAVGVCAAVGVAVGVGVGLGAPDWAQYLPPVFKLLSESSCPPQTIISLPVHTAV